MLSTTSNIRPGRVSRSQVPPLQHAHTTPPRPYKCSTRVTAAAAAAMATRLYGEAFDGLRLVAPADLGVVKVLMDSARSQAVAQVVVKPGADVAVGEAEQGGVRYPSTWLKIVNESFKQLTQTVCTRLFREGRSGPKRGRRRFREGSRYGCRLVRGTESCQHR